MNMQVQPAIAGAAALPIFEVGQVLPVAVPSPSPSVEPPLDCEKVEELLMKLAAFSELTRDHGRLKEDSGLELIGSTLVEMTYDILEMVSAERYRQEKEQNHTDED
jgi:hypothetical protein